MKNQVFFISIIVMILSLYSCEEKEAPQPTITVKYLALGDSYTIGQGVEENERWPNQLSAQLESNGIEVQKTQIIAQTGWKTSDLLNGIADSTLNDYDLISLLIGVNNQYRGRSSLNFKEEFEELLNMAIQFTKSEKVTVLTIPDWGKTPFARDRNIKSIEDSINVYNSIVKDVCKIYNVNVIDIVDITRQVNNRPELLARDSLHPSGLMYGIWAKKMLDEWKI